MATDSVHLIAGAAHVDDRGFVSFVNDFDFTGVKRFYMVENHAQGLVRAWHAHQKEAKYAFVAQGAALVAAVRIDNWERPTVPAKVERFVLAGQQPAVLYIPPGYANGFKSLTPDMKILFMSTSTVQESLNDDFRWPTDYFGDVWKVVER
jgi:dTDP-4-dehydrorhamnose 3,5-epimerase